MYGFQLRNLVDRKCVPCTSFTACTIQEGYKEKSKEFKVDVAVYEKLENCLFFRKCDEED